MSKNFGKSKYLSTYQCSIFWSDIYRFIWSNWQIFGGILLNSSTHSFQKPFCFNSNSGLGSFNKATFSSVQKSQFTVDIFVFITWNMFSQRPSFLFHFYNKHGFCYSHHLSLFFTHIHHFAFRHSVEGKRRYLQVDSCCDWISWSHSNYETKQRYFQYLCYFSPNLRFKLGGLNCHTEVHT